jgi:hypothetical protein
MVRKLLVILGLFLTVNLSADQVTLDGDVFSGEKVIITGNYVGIPASATCVYDQQKRVIACDSGKIFTQVYVYQIGTSMEPGPGNPSYIGSSATLGLSFYGFNKPSSLVIPAPRATSRR